MSNPIGLNTFRKKPMEFHVCIDYIRNIIKGTKKNYISDCIGRDSANWVGHIINMDIYGKKDNGILVLIRSLNSGTFIYILNNYLQKYIAQ